MKRAFAIAMAYFGVTVGAGFASGQEMLQYYVAHGWWGILGAIVVLLIMPLTAMIALQYGSYFQASSHKRVFTSITSKIPATFIDYAVTATQFAVAFVMLSGAGANLHQQFGLPLWVGSTLMLILVLVFGMMDVDKVTNAIGAITPVVIIFMTLAAIAALTDPPEPFDGIQEFATTHIDPAVPNWWLSTLNYIGLSMMGGVSMGVVIGGANLDTKSAGRGGFLGGFLFGAILLLLVVGMLFQVTELYDDALPTLTLVNEIHPALGTIAALATYLMIFSTALGSFYALTRRLVPNNPKRFKPVFIVVVFIGYALSFVDFATLVNTVFPALGYAGIVMIVVLIGTWFMRGRGIVNEESSRRDKIRNLIWRMLDPNEKFTTAHRAQLSREVFSSPLESTKLRSAMAEEVIDELDADSSSDFDKDSFELDQQWVQGRYDPTQAGEVRIVNESDPK
ncbi:YkvI family membrane protein [Corynebacterium lubricantis]|uniref:YkvI family membrane protein n=1 Tax=Corynebacterium lubricantis TaxID=541095 RepID=UPI00037323BC|nr:hypothetical protein [Corynebacterium lubricantis]